MLGLSFWWSGTPPIKDGLRDQELLNVSFNLDFDRWSCFAVGRDFKSAVKRLAVVS